MTSYSNVEHSEKFMSISKQLLSLVDHRVNDKNKINKYLTELNDLNYYCCTRDNDVTMLLINRLCTIIQISDLELIKNHCQFIINLTRARINISNRTYSTCKRWILQMLEFTGTEARKLILLALKSIIEIGTFDVLCQDIQCLLEDDGLLRLLITERNSESVEINLLAINCIEAFLKNVECSTNSITRRCRMLIKELIYDTAILSLEKGYDNQLHYYKITCTSLRILRYLTINKLLSEDETAIGEICGIIQASLFYGISSYPNLKPECLRPALMNIPERIGPPLRRSNVSLTSKTRMKKNQSKKVTSRAASESCYDANGINKISSDSDTSDTENLSRDRAGSRVRMEAIHLLHAVIHGISCRDMFGYWSQIIVNTSGKRARVLVSLINSEPVSKLRQLELNTLTEVIHGARTFLSYAEESDHSTFLTVFGTVSVMIREIHIALHQLFSTEKNVAVLIHALKCSTALVHATPYSRLKPQLATDLMQQCRNHLLHTDPTIRVAALSVFEALASVDKFTPEIVSILSEKSEGTCRRRSLSSSISQLTMCSGNHDIEEVDIADVVDHLEDEKIENDLQQKSIDVDAICFIVHICLRNISNKVVQVPVKLQSLKLLSALINNDTQCLIFSHLEMTVQHLIEACHETEPQVVLHSCRVIEKMSSYAASNSLLKGQALGKIWNMVFELVISLTQSPHTNLREVACDCLGTINNEIFFQQSPANNVLIITTLLGAVRDEESAVRAAGLRALGMLVVLPSLEENTGFIMDFIDVVSTALKDDNLGVRVKAAWALANLSDCLIRQTNNKDIEPLPLETFLNNLYKSSVKAAQDNNKVKCNVLRAVGNIIHLYKEVEMVVDVTDGLQVLMTCATTGNDMKVRWNACRALGFIMSYKPDSILPPNWKDRIFPALCDLICHSPNFKVRTNAAWSLAVCVEYGKYIPFLWKSIVMALDNSQHVPTFVEYPHRDALVQQLCLALGHVAAHTSLSDLLIFWPEIKDHVQDIATHIKHFHERVLPEKADDFMTAKLLMKMYVETASTSNEQRIAEILASLFEIPN